MIPEYWLRQTIDKPLFSELLWSRPENRQFAGKLAVIGGNLHGFAAPAEAYSESLKAGVGLTRVLLPDAVKSVVKALFETVEFAPATPSGSFSQKALAEWLELGSWADATLLAGDLGRNSETAIIFEKFIDKHTGAVIITKDAADYALSLAGHILQRPDTTLVISMAQLQKLGVQAGLTRAITLSMDLVQLVDILHELTTITSLAIVTKHQNNYIVAVAGQVVTTKITTDTPIWRVQTAAYVSVWLLQNPGKLLDALATGISSMQSP